MFASAALYQKMPRNARGNLCVSVPAGPKRQHETGLYGQNQIAANTTLASNCSRGQLSESSHLIHDRLALKNRPASAVSTAPGTWNCDSVYLA
jgi:hypothetical protein